MCVRETKREPHASWYWTTGSYDLGVTDLTVLEWGVTGLMARVESGVMDRLSDRRRVTATLKK